ncbi:LOB domain-containing protein 1-like [Cornus florida]|uniref:LOB domain-containing protein 1-like n=1 Tax=Cornus florida TaxID=4283 RepID=UPI00289F646E|nr:LOB domain-containing protein 1-like [Cornus florida]
MEKSAEKRSTTTLNSTSPSPPPPSHVVISPCAACKSLRRKCADTCLLAPYFPPNEPLKFTTAHRVFGASNIIKFLQELPEFQRADAVSSMVYEANARLRDPVYGCTGVICQLQKQVTELQAQLAEAQAEVVTVQCEQANLVSSICSEMAQQQTFNNYIISSPQSFENNLNFQDDTSLESLWEPLWT